MGQRTATLALSGGGARGIAHLGAIEELVNAGIIADRIVGVSIGSLAGAMYAFDPDIAQVQRRALEYLQSLEFARHQRILFGARRAREREGEVDDGTGYRRLAELWRASRILHRAFRQGSLLPGPILEAIIDRLLPDADIADAAIPLKVVAVDLHTGKPVVLEKGPLRLAVRASASVPGVFPPVAFDDYLLSDIGNFYALPIGIARTFAPRFLVAIDVDARLKPLTHAPSVLEILIRMNNAAGAMFRERLGEQADLLIAPEVGDVEWCDFTSAESMLAAGRLAAKQALAAAIPPQTWLERLFAGHWIPEWNLKSFTRSRELVKTWDERPATT